MSERKIDDIERPETTLSAEDAEGVVGGSACGSGKKPGRGGGKKGGGKQGGGKQGGGKGGKKGGGGGKCGGG